MSTFLVKYRIGLDAADYDAPGVDKADSIALYARAFELRTADILKNWYFEAVPGCMTPSVDFRKRHFHNDARALSIVIGRVGFKTGPKIPDWVVEDVLNLARSLRDSSDWIAKS